VRLGPGLARRQHLQRRTVRGRQGSDRPPHLQDGVDRRLDLAGDVADHVDHVFQVLAVEGLLLAGADGPHQLGEGDAPPGTRHGDRGEIGQGAALAGREAQVDEDRFLLLRQVEESGALAAEGDGEGAGHVLHGDAREGGLLPVNAEGNLGAVVLPVPVHVNHAGGLLHDRLDPGGKAGAAGIVRAVDFGHQGGEHRRAGGDLRHLDPGAVAVGDRLHQRPDPLGDVVGLVLALLLSQQVHLDICEVAPLAQVIVAHQAVEVERGAATDVALEIGHLRHGPQGVPHLPDDPGGLLQGGAVRCVDDHLQLVLVVEGEHLHRNPPEEDQGAGEEQEHHHRCQEAEAQPSVVNKPPHPVAVECRQPRIIIASMPFLVPEPRTPSLSSHQPVGEVGGDDEGDEHGEEHGHARPDRDRPHVGAHKAADKPHGEDRGDYGEGRQHRRVADLVHRPDRRLQRLHHRGGEVAVDVLHHDDGVVHQDADGEDQGEEGDPVEGVADQVKDQHGQGQGDRDGDCRHRAGPPPHEEGNEDRHRDGGEEHVEEELVVLLPGGLAVVAGHGHLHVGRDERPFQRLHLFHQVLRHPGGVGPFSLGHGDGDGGVIG